MEGNLSSLQDSIIKLHNKSMIVVFSYTIAVICTSMLLGWTVSPMLLALLLLRFLWTLITSTLQGIKFVTTIYLYIHYTIPLPFIEDRSLLPTT